MATRRLFYDLFLVFFICTNYITIMNNSNLVFGKRSKLEDLSQYCTNYPPINPDLVFRRSKREDLNKYCTNLAAVQEKEEEAIQKKPIGKVKDIIGGQSGGMWQRGGFFMTCS